MSAKFTVNWSKRKKFDKDNFCTGVDGVYLVGYRDTKTDERFVVYVGQGDIDVRLADHFEHNDCVKKRTNQSGKVGYYRFASCGNEDDRLDIELGLYENHGGSAKLCNEIDPPGSGRRTGIEVEESFPE